MFAPAERQRYNDRRKYSWVREPLTDRHVGDHLAGRATYGAPLVHEGRACLLSVDIDGGGPPAIHAVQDEWTRRGWYAVAEYTPRPGWEECDQRGYVHVIIRECVDSQRLTLLDQDIARSVAAPGYVFDPRVNMSATRLPLGRHQHTGQFAEIWLPDGTIIPHTTDRREVLHLIAAQAQAHPAPLDQLPQPAVRRAAAPPTLTEAQRQADYSHKDIQRLYNEARDVCDVLEAHGGQRNSRTSWHCPCGLHAHGDQSASLLIKSARDGQYGAYIVQGYASSCRFYSGERQVWDSFNIELTLSGRSYSDMLTEARRYLGLPGYSSGRRSGGSPTASPTPPPPAHTPPEPAQSDHHETRRARPVSPPPSPTPSTAARVREEIIGQIAFSPLSPSARLVANYLLNAAGDKLWCRPSMARIAAELQLNRRTVQRAIYDIVSAQLIRVRPSGTSNGGDETNIYDLSRGGGGGRFPRPS